VTTLARESAAPARLLRLGFLGLGWIGRHRMKAVIESGLAEAAAVCDPSEAARAAAAAECPGAVRLESLDALLGEDLDGLVIATPSALHAEQAIAALERGIPVFCQKPLARTAHEAGRVIDAARRADRLLGVDFSYRFAHAFSQILTRARAGDLGELYAVDLTFHNAYGPDKGWSKDPALAGGGCLIDLGVHLVDFALLALDSSAVVDAQADLFAAGRPVRDPSGHLEDFALARFSTASGATVRLACSWWHSLGQDCIIRATLHGTRGSAEVRNVGGSFFDFHAALLRGTAREPLSEPPDAWPGRAITDWARRLIASNRFNPEVASARAVAEVLDRMYGR
jgi:predicted dehydrogenase